MTRLSSSFVRDRELILVEAEVVGPAGRAIEVRVVLDTGAAATTLTPSMIEKVGYTERDRFKTAKVHTAIGEEQGYWLRVAELTVLGVTTPNFALSVFRSATRISTGWSADRRDAVDGELVHVSPADPPHAERHFQLCALLEAHTSDAFEAGGDLLTRTSQIDDFAPDASVYPAAPDPSTGRRQLEQLAFEVVSTQTLAHAARKAAKLTARGVRRVFAIDVERARALEWSAALGTWSVLDSRRFSTDCIEPPLVGACSAGSRPTCASSSSIRAQLVNDSLTNCRGARTSQPRR